MLRVIDGPTPVGAIASPKIALTSVLFPTPTRPASMMFSWAFPPNAWERPSRKNFSRSNSSWPSDLYRSRPVEDPSIGAPYLSCVSAGVPSLETAAPGSRPLRCSFTSRRPVHRTHTQLPGYPKFLDPQSHD